MVAALIMMGCDETSKTENTADEQPTTTVEATEANAEPAEVFDAEPAWEDSWQGELFETMMQLYAPQKVEGQPNIVSFMKALPLYKQEYPWYPVDGPEVEEEGYEPEIDTKNGYYHFMEEGSGGAGYYGAIWNRTDGKKLFILSYYNNDWSEHAGHTESFPLQFGSQFYYFGAERYGDSEPVSFLDCLTGFAAYLYNPDNQMLEPLEESPFNGWGYMTTCSDIILPQKGKDVEVRMGAFDDYTTYMFKWNGMTFDMQ